MPTPQIFCRFKIPLLFCHFLCFSLLLFFLVAENIRWPRGLNVQRCCPPGGVAAASKPCSSSQDPRGRLFCRHSGGVFLHFWACFSGSVAACTVELAAEQQKWSTCQAAAVRQGEKELARLKFTRGNNKIYCAILWGNKGNLLCNIMRTCVW